MQPLVAKVQSVLGGVQLGSPELDRTLTLSELFGVSTDYLIRDDRDAPTLADAATTGAGTNGTNDTAGTTN